MPIWNPWKNSGNGTEATSNDRMPVLRDRSHAFRMRAGGAPVLVCTTGDFFSEGADALRDAAIAKMRERRDLTFLLFCDHIERWKECLPDDWGEADENIGVLVRIPNEDVLKIRLDALQAAPFSWKEILFSGYLPGKPVLPEGVDRVSVLGGTAPLSYEKLLLLRDACKKSGAAFFFAGTGDLLEKDGKVYRIPEYLQEEQAKKAGADLAGEKIHPRFSSSAEDGMSSGNLRTDRLFSRLGESGFRSGFFLDGKDKAYIREKGMDTIRQHAADFVAKRLAPAEPENDGKQTPMRGHPVFKAQHATGCCCRGCLAKWHGIPKGRPLSQNEQDYIVGILMEWIRRQCL